MSSLLSVSDPACAIIPVNECGKEVIDNPRILFKMSSLENAHVEWWDQNNYDYVFCCNFGNGIQPSECSTDSAELISMNALTNAHAEIPSADNYDDRVCYNVDSLDYAFDCLYSNGEPSVSTEENRYYPHLKLSSSTNAHVSRAVDEENFQLWCNVLNPVVLCGNEIVEGGG